MVDCYLLLRERTSECDKKLEFYEKYCGKDTHIRAQY